MIFTNCSSGHWNLTVLQYYWLSGFFWWYASVRVICWNMYVIRSFYPYIQQCLCNRCAIVEWVADGLWKTMSPKNICILHLFCHILSIFFFLICKNYSFIPFHIPELNFFNYTIILPFEAKKTPNKTKTQNMTITH